MKKHFVLLFVFAMLIGVCASRLPSRQNHLRNRHQNPPIHMYHLQLPLNQLCHRLWAATSCIRVQPGR